MVEFLAWVEVNKKRLLYGVVGALVLGMAVYLFGYFRQQREVEANAALFALDKLPEGRDRAARVAAVDYLRVVDNFSGTRAAERALLLAAGALFAEKNYDEARDKFKQFISNHGDSPSAATAAYGIAACADAKNEVDTAMTGYNTVISTYPQAPEVSQAKFALALLHEAKNQPDSALKIYDDVLKPRQPSVWHSEANLRREMLLTKWPHLAVTNLPPAAFAPHPGIPVKTNVTVVTNVTPPATVKVPLAPPPAAKKP